MIPKKILLCTDFSENSQPARHLAIEYAAALGAELRVLHVINSSRLGYPSLEEGIPVDIRSALEGIQESVDKALALIETDCRKTVTHVHTHSSIGNPPYEINRFACENAIEMIIMGTHGRTGIKHLIMGSTAENVVRTAKCPVLTVRSPQ